MNWPKYAERINIAGPNDTLQGGTMQAYQSVNEYYHDFNGAMLVTLVLAPTAIFTAVPLYTMSNGVKVSMEYTLIDDTDHNVYNLRRKYVYRDANGTFIKEYGIYLTQQSYNPQHSYRPYLNCRQAVASTIYITNPSVAGDDADSIFIPGTLYWEKPAVVDLKELTGSIKASEVSSGGWEWSQAGALNRADFTELQNAVIAAGDGSDPFTDEPADEPSPSKPGGGDRPSPDGGNAIDFPGLPSTNIIQTGLVSVYNPDNTMLRSLAGVLWGNDFEGSIKKILNDPFDGIIGLSLIPVTPHTSGSEDCKIGNFNTEVNMPLVDQQYMTIDCGSLKVNESWHNALDYSPTTVIDIFIPFVGFKRLNTEDVMGKTIALKYNFDILSGSAVAMIKCDDKVMYTYPCKLSYDVPLTGSNKAALYTGIINVAMSAIHGGAVGGAMGAVGGAATSAIQTATSKQSDIDRSGSITSNTGVLGDFTPYLLIHRPMQSMPQDFRKIKGYQSNITKSLNQVSGYTEVDYIHLESINGATDTELAEIETLLKRGVII